MGRLLRAHGLNSSLENIALKEARGKIALEEREPGNTEMFSQQTASYPGSLVE